MATTKWKLRSQFSVLSIDISFSSTYDPACFEDIPLLLVVHAANSCSAMLYLEMRSFHFRRMPY